ncbi:MAG: acid phosphatase [Chlorobium sp.]|nr:acid phosphatase [Chlorobium sp.]MCF8271584.1 acid phosphatase [Chlorobium sp.]MCF8287935.1 acid phosphatase [Chlorobium sp.]MCF8291480.1 acid phosphatase [Chlorobium sp.]
MNNFFRSLCSGMVLLLFAGCASSANNNFNSLLWMQTSAEYKANTGQAYNAALRNIDAALADRRWTAAIEQVGDCSSLPPAVIMDIDETVLDNSSYMGRVVLENGSWSAATWDEWVALQEATAVPGAIEFINAMKGKGVRVLLISNRECGKRSASGPPCPQESDTIANLRKTGMLDVQPGQILLKGEEAGWTSEKKSRRELVAQRYRIVMLFGDDLGDFLPGVKSGITPEERDSLTSAYRGYWGERWFMLPNPTYGSWMSVLGDPKSRYIRAYGKQ